MIKYILLMLLLSCSSPQHSIPVENSISVENSEEKSWRVGKKFSIYYITLNTIPSVIDFVLVVGEHNIAIDKVLVKGNSSWVKWTWFRGGEDSEVDMSTGTELVEIPLNETVNSSSGVTFLINPNTTGTWQQLVSAVPIYGMTAAYSRVIMYEEILTRKMAFKSKSKNILRIENLDPGTTHLEVIIDFERL